jgi:hypothetical protein
MSLGEYTDYLLAQSSRIHIESQACFLTGMSGARGLQEIESHLSSGKLLLFPLEKFDESCVILERIFPDDFRNCAYAMRNASEKDQEITEQTVGKIEKLHFTQVDLRLLALAENHLDNLIEINFDNLEDFGEYLAGFRSRCKWRRSWPYSLFSVLHRGTLRLWRLLRTRQ